MKASSNPGTRQGHLFNSNRKFLRFDFHRIFSGLLPLALLLTGGFVVTSTTACTFTLRPPEQCSNSEFVVTEIADSFDGFCTDHCSLRDAVFASNTCAGEQTIRLSDATYTLSLTTGDEQGALEIRDDVDILGVGPNTTRVEGVSGWSDRIFTVTSGTDAFFRDLAIAGGDIPSGNGGGMLNEGTTFLRDVLFEANTTMGNGGGLYNAGSLFLQDGIIFRNNHADSPVGEGGSFPEGCGGGLATEHNLEIPGVMFNGNTGHKGGSICALEGISWVVINDSVVTGSSAIFGGGIYSLADDRTEINSSQITENSGVFGGGIYAGGSGRFILRGSRIEANETHVVPDRSTGGSAGGLGGGLYLATEYAILDTLIINNVAAVGGGGLNVDVSIEAINQLVTSSISQNRVLGGPGGAVNYGGGVGHRVDNSTFSGNRATEGGSAINIQGDGTTVDLVFATVARNVGTPALGMSPGSGPGNYIFPQNSLLVLNQPASCSVGQTYSLSRGGNVANESSCYAPSVSSNDIVHPDSIRISSALVDVGGTLLHTLESANPARNHVPLSDRRCNLTDQRRLTRPVGDGCDSGAYEDDRLPLAGEISEPPVVMTPTAIGAGIPTLLVDSLCWEGPGSAYQVVSSIDAGTEVFLLGQGDVEGWLVVDNPRFAGVPCWLDEDDLDVDPSIDRIELLIFVSPVLDITPTVTATQVVAPAAPGNLQTTNRTCNANDFIIELGWSDVADNEDGYRVYRNGGLIATLGANATSYSDTPSYTGPHTYEVRAFNAAGEAGSNTVQEVSCIF